jgi:hypothetical protein
MSNLIAHPLTAAVSGGSGVALLDMVTQPSTLDNVLKAVIAIVSILPALKQIIKKKKTPKTNVQEN